MNAFQRIIIALFGMFFIYFSILHLPFKTEYGEIEYDTLFSTKPNLDISRLVLIIFVVAILCAALFLLCKNLKFRLSQGSTKRRLRIALYISAAVIILITVSLYLINWNSKTHFVPPRVSAPRTDSTAVRMPTSNSDASEKEKLFLDSTNCAEENALRQFRSYMKFNYPDWKIYGKPVAQKSSTEFSSRCSFKIQFTTANPHIDFYTKKEVMVVKVTFNYDYSRYDFETIRGLLY